MKYVRPSICALCILAGSLKAHAFWSWVGPAAHHQDYTKAAIGAPSSFTFAGQSYRFSQKAIDAINLANAQVDQESVYPYNAADHFDGQQFVLGVKQLALTRKELVKALTPPVSLDTQAPGSQAYAWQLLGFMLHGIQDFYAHSTWIEDGNIESTSIVHFGVLTANPPNLSFLQPAAGSVCTPSAYPLIPKVTQLTSGYYNPDDPLGLTDPAPPGLCQHGTLAQAIATCASLIPVTVQGISKDSPCALYLQGPITSHIIAKNQAIQETQEFVQDLITDLDTASNAQGFCALLDLPSNTPICAVPASGLFHSFSGTFNFGNTIQAFHIYPVSATQWVSCQNPSGCPYTDSGTFSGTIVGATDAATGDTTYSITSMTLNSSVAGVLTWVQDIGGFLTGPDGAVYGAGLIEANNTGSFGSATFAVVCQFGPWINSSTATTLPGSQTGDAFATGTTTSAVTAETTGACTVTLQ
jgi:hypothetical protein